jgi:hypothetical protein
VSPSGGRCEKVTLERLPGASLSSGIIGSLYGMSVRGPTLERPPNTRIHSNYSRFRWCGRGYPIVATLYRCLVAWSAVFTVNLVGVRRATLEEPTLYCLSVCWPLVNMVCAGGVT